MINIYRITNEVNDKVYIGQTIDPIEERLQEHGYDSSHCKHLKNAIKKYGRDKFKIELLTICEGQECANCIETFYIAANDSVKNGYNIVEIAGPAPMTGRRHSEESKRKISESQKGRIQKPMTDETKNKMSISRTIKFTDKQILDIQNDSRSNRVICKEYNVSHEKIRQIKKRFGEL